MKRNFQMNNVNRIIALTVFCSVCGISIPGLTLAVSLEQYLDGNMGQPVSFLCAVSSTDISPSSHMTSASLARSGGSAMGKLHKYMGYGTIIAAAAAGVSGSGGGGFHKGAGDAAAGLAVATCITGFAEYGHYFDMDEGMSAYNIHIVLAAVATIGFVATAVDANSNDDNGHAGLGIGSAVLMTVPIVILHF
jgi:hypothetical protein